MQVQSLLLCAIFCGLAGAYLSLGYVTLFAENMTAGRGWISLAAIILVDGHPYGIALISLVFGFFDGLGLFLQSYGVSPQFTSMVPYVATLVALYVYSRRAREREKMHYKPDAIKMLFKNAFILKMPLRGNFL